MKLIVHIGDGKTGSTSIQNTLERARDGLSGMGIAYLGRMLEFAQSSVAKDWQTPAGAEMLLHQMPDADVTDEVTEVLRREMAHLQDKGVNTAIWSNEALFARNAGIIPALKILQGEGVEVLVVLYLRRHDKWARSAYAQWGIRHKSYQGPVKPFADWIAERPVRKAPNLMSWNAAFGKDLVLRNFESLADVTADFLAFVGATGIEAHRVYETPSLEELTAHALFNDQFSGVVLPDRYHRFMQANNGVAPEPSARAARYSALVPDQAALDAVLADCAEDISEVNALLTEKGETPFDTTALAARETQPDLMSLLAYAVQLNFKLHDRVAKLERKIADLES